MTPKPLDQQLQEHQVQRPEMPRGLHPDDPDFIQWYHVFSTWADLKQRLQARLTARDHYHEVKVTKSAFGDRKGTRGGAE